MHGFVCMERTMVLPFLRFLFFFLIIYIGSSHLYMGLFAWNKSARTLVGLPNSCAESWHMSWVAGYRPFLAHFILSLIDSNWANNPHFIS